MTQFIGGFNDEGMTDQILRGDTEDGMSECVLMWHTGHKNSTKQHKKEAKEFNTVRQSMQKHDNEAP